MWIGCAAATMMIASFGLAKSHASTCEAEIAIQGSSARGLRFAFTAKGSTTPIQVFSITVTRHGERVCRVSGRQKDGTIRLVVGDWTYGDLPARFVYEAPCTRLVEGQQYHVSVIGQCVGSTVFGFDRHSRNK
jgi:hypothetical protein